MCIAQEAPVRVWAEQRAVGAAATRAEWAHAAAAASLLAEAANVATQPQVTKHLAADGAGAVTLVRVGGAAAAVECGLHVLRPPRLLHLLEHCGTVLRHHRRGAGQCICQTEAARHHHARGARRIALARLRPPPPPHPAPADAASLSPLRPIRPTFARVRRGDTVMDELSRMVRDWPTLAGFQPGYKPTRAWGRMYHEYARGGRGVDDIAPVREVVHGRQRATEDIEVALQHDAPGAQFTRVRLRRRLYRRMLHLDDGRRRDAM
jgi:hypothetical protein